MHEKDILLKLNYTNIGKNKYIMNQNTLLVSPTTPTHICYQMKKARNGINGNYTK